MRILLPFTGTGEVGVFGHVVSQRSDGIVGVAFKKLPSDKPLYPCVTLYNSDARCKIISGVPVPVVGQDVRNENKCHIY